MVKVARGGCEPKFYREVVPRCPFVASLAPALDASVDDGDATWLVLEWISEPLPRERWIADSEVIATLRKLHQAYLPIPQSSWFAPSWTREMSATFLQWAPDVDHALLEDLQGRAQALFEPRAWMSGDPNPTNWGMRSNRALALFDWERFGRGTPALDLAITIPGLGAPDDFVRVARAYGEDARAADIACAKAWSVVEFVNHHGRMGSKTLERIRPHVAAWLRSLDAGRPE